MRQEVMMLDPEMHDCIANINYWAMYEKTIDRKMDRILGKFVYDPLSKVSPRERLNQILGALASEEKLNEIGMPLTHRRQSEEGCRELLTQLIDRIEFYESNGLPLFENINELAEGNHLEKLRILLQPLSETSTLSDAIKRFEEKVLPSLHSYINHGDAEMLIRYVLWFDTNKIEIQSMVTPPVTDAMLREYLRNIGWVIKKENHHTQDSPLS
jgi:hypothetical protein